MRILTIDTIHDQDPLAYAVDLARRCGLGDAKENNGLLVVVVIKDHKWAIATGLGIEEDLTDEYCQWIGQQYFIPKFKKGDFQTGLYEGSAVLAHKLAELYGVELPRDPG